MLDLQKGKRNKGMNECIYCVVRKLRNRNEKRDKNLFKSFTKCGAVPIALNDLKSFNHYFIVVAEVH